MNVLLYARGSKYQNVSNTNLYVDINRAYQTNNTKLPLYVVANKNYNIKSVHINNITLDKFYSSIVYDLPIAGNNLIFGLPVSGIISDSTTYNMGSDGYSEFDSQSYKATNFDMVFQGNWKPKNGAYNRTIVKIPSDAVITSNDYIQISYYYGFGTEFNRKIYLDDSFKPNDLIEFSWYLDDESATDLDFSLHYTPKPTEIPVTVKGDNIKDYSPQKLSLGDNNIVINSLDGYVFKNSGSVILYDDDKVKDSYNIDGSNTNTINVSINVDNTVTAVTINISASEEHSTDSLFNHTYSVTKTQLSQLSKDFIWNYDGSTYDISKFINNIFKFPFFGSFDYVSNYISVGNHKSSVVSQEITTNNVKIDFGKVYIDNLGNGLDYQTINPTLYAPAVKPITLDIYDIINKNIGLEYIFNLINGNITVNVYSDDILINSHSEVISDSIGFYNNLTNSTKNYNNQVIINNITTPYILIKFKKPVESNLYPANYLSTGNKLKSGLYTGYISNSSNNLDFDTINYINNSLKNGFIL